MAQFIEDVGVVLTEEEKDNLKTCMVFDQQKRTILPNLREAIKNSFAGWKIKEVNQLNKQNDKINIPSRG